MWLARVSEMMISRRSSSSSWFYKLSISLAFANSVTNLCPLVRTAMMCCRLSKKRSRRRKSDTFNACISLTMGMASKIRSVTCLSKLLARSSMRMVLINVPLALLGLISSNDAIISSIVSFTFYSRLKRVSDSLGKSSLAMALTVEY